jgi:hypothetical protein
MKVHSFAGGDVVRLRKNKPDFDAKKGDKCIVVASTIEGDVSTTIGAWFSTSDFELVHRATKKSLDKLFKLLEEDKE